MKAAPDAGTGRSWRQTVWAYARHELLYLCWALMDVALTMPVALSVMAWTRTVPVVSFSLWLLFVALLSFYLHRFLSVIEAPVRHRQNILLLALAATFLISARALLFDPPSLFDVGWAAELFNHFTETGNALWRQDVGLFFLLAFTWWRGLSLTNRGVDFRTSGLRLRLGALILAPAVIVITMLADGPPALPFILLYFLAGLLTVALTRAEEIATNETGHSYPMEPRWVAVVLLSSLLTVLVAGVTAATLGGGALVRVLAWMEPLWQALRLLATAVVIVVAYAATFLLTPPLWLLQRLAERLNWLPQADPEEGAGMETGAIDINDLLEAVEQAGMPGWVDRALALLVIAAVLLFLHATFARYFRERVMVYGSSETASKSIANEESGKGLGERIRRRLGLWRERRAAASIRRIYRRMSAAAAAHGHPRAPTETPFEYLTTLKNVWPERTDEATLITGAYVNVRYGELPETKEELEEIRAAWERLQGRPPPEQEGSARAPGKRKI